MKNVLLIIDVQNDFCENGTLAIPYANEIIEPINKIMPEFDAIIATQDWHPKNHISFAVNHFKKEFDVVNTRYGKQILWPVHCVQNTLGAKFHPQLHANKIHHIVRTGYNPFIDSYSGFFYNDKKTSTGLEKLISSDDNLIICGLARDYCVEWTYQDALKLGFKASILEDCCRSMNR
ncbi:Nicotinamidase [Candidatus Hepatincola sp. Pdp]